MSKTAKVMLVLGTLLSLSLARAQAAGSTFVGNYGEVIELPPGYSANAAMHEGREVVIMRPEGSSETANGQVAPNDFETLKAFELVVTPKTIAKLSSLAELCELRRQSLKELRTEFKEVHCLPGSGCSIPGIDWPAHTCEYDIVSPYRLTQVFSERSDAYFALTTGVPLTEELAYPVVKSVMTAVNPPGAESPETSPRYESARGPRSWAVLAPERPWPQLWAFVCGLLLLAGFLPVGPWKDRRRRAAVVGLVFGNGAVALGLIVTAAEIFANAGPLNNLTLLGVLIIGVGLMAARAWARTAQWRNAGTVIVAAALGSAPLLMLAVLALKDHPEPAGESGALVSYIVLSWAGALIGLCAGSAARPADDGGGE